MKKEYLKYLASFAIILILLYGYNTFFMDKSSMQVDKEAYYSDCYHNNKEPNKALELSQYLDSTKLSANNKAVNDEYETSNCVVLKGYSLNNYLVLDEYKIDHKAGQNDQSYQISYQEVLAYLKAKSDKSDLDKQIIKGLEYYLANKEVAHLIPQAKGKYQENSIMIGPDEKVVSAKYVLTINIDVVSNTIYQIKDQQKVVKETKYLFDGISMQYQEVGE